MKSSWFVFAAICTACSGCTVRYLLADTTSDQVVEFKDNYYVGYSRDSVLEFHYDLWSENGKVWLSILNRSDRLAILRPDSCVMQYGGLRFWFDQYQDWSDYVDPLLDYMDTLLNDSVMVILEPELYLPLLPGRWKGLLGEELYFNKDDWKSFEDGVSFDKSSTPLLLDFRLCYHLGDVRSQLTCEDHTLWIESLEFLRGKEFHQKVDAPDYNTSDKFYLVHVPGAGAASILAAIVSLALIF